MAIPDYVTPTRISESAAIDMLQKLQSATLKLPAELATGPIESTFVRTEVPPSDQPPIVVLHGFDSSCLEFRRLLPELEKLGLEAFALDVLGWGFTDTTAARSVGVEVKREALYAFWKMVIGGRKMLLAGVSLGAAVIIDFFASYPEAVDSVALVDPQGFIDGAPPVPKPLARVGIKVLGSWWLRAQANQLAYYDTTSFATDDAIRVGLLHCARPQWEDDSIDWLLSGGYSVSTLVPKLTAVPSLIMWGRQDQILPPAEYVPKFIAALPAANFRWVEQCGHSPHLEQPRVLALAFSSFIQGQPIEGDSDASEIVALANRSPMEKALAPWRKINEVLDTPTF